MLRMCGVCISNLCRSSGRPWNPRAGLDLLAGCLDRERGQGPGLDPDLGLDLDLGPDPARVQVPPPEDPAASTCPSCLHRLSWPRAIWTRTAAFPKTNSISWVPPGSTPGTPRKRGSLALTN